jgi:LCP family protein required for cell wall assembly
MTSLRQRPPSPHTPSARRSLRARWQGLRTRAKVGYVIATLLTVSAVAVSLFGYSLYLHLNNNLNVTDIKGLSPNGNYGVQNILILGSQTRDGQGPGFGYDPDTNLSDNLLLVHLDATHTHATIVSIPRDTMVYEPQCTSRFNNQIVPAQPQAIIDGAMNLGGPSCAVATVNNLTGITMSHFIEFTFNSFRAMVNTIGGVEVCLPQAVDDPYSGLDLSAGYHLISGDTALAFVRTRHGVGTGTDLGRIELQQEFFSSLIQKVKSRNTLENPLELYDIANTATQQLTVDQGLGSVSKLVTLAETMRNLHTKNVTFITMPTVEDPDNNNRLLPLEPEDDIIWNMLQTGQTWQGGLPTVPPGSVTVNVLNGTGIDGLAASTASTLKQFGYNIGTVGDAPFTDSTTVSYGTPAQAEGAYTMMGALQQAPLVQNGVPGGITLKLGTNFSGLNTPPAPAPTPTASASPGGKGSAKTAAPAASPSAPAVSTTPDAGQGPDGTPLQIPGQSAAIQTRNAAAPICSGVPDANPNTGAP